MDGRAIDAEEDPICNRSPSWVLCVTIEAHLNKTHQTQLRSASNHIWVGEIWLRSHIPRSNFAAQSQTQYQKTTKNKKSTDLVLRLGFQLLEHSILVIENLGRHCRESNSNRRGLNQIESEEVLRTNTSSGKREKETKNIQVFKLQKEREWRKKILNSQIEFLGFGIFKRRHFITRGVRVRDGEGLSGKTDIPLGFG